MPLFKVYFKQFTDKTIKLFIFVIVLQTFSMKNKTLIIIVIITATAAILSLGIYQKRTHQINASLLQIEQLMYERPDSAWKILQTHATHFAGT